MKRYNIIETQSHGAIISNASDGEWVKHADVLELLDERDSVKEAFRHVITFAGCSDEQLMSMLLDATYDRDEKFKQINELRTEIIRRMRNND